MTGHSRGMSAQATGRSRSHRGLATVSPRPESVQSARLQLFSGAAVWPMAWEWRPNASLSQRFPRRTRRIPPVAWGALRSLGHAPTAGTAGRGLEPPRASPLSQWERIGHPGRSGWGRRCDPSSTPPAIESAAPCRGGRRGGRGRCMAQRPQRAPMPASRSASRGALGAFPRSLGAR